MCCKKASFEIFVIELNLLNIRGPNDVNTKIGGTWPADPSQSLGMITRHILKDVFCGTQPISFSLKLADTKSALMPCICFRACIELRFVSFTYLLEIYPGQS